MTGGAAARIRIDKWLWFARFFRTRGLAADCAGSGRLRVNGARCEKPAQPVQPGDVLTFPQAGRVRVVRVEAVGQRRGPAQEAQALYTDLDPPAAAPPAEEPGGRDAGAGRPTKRERRAIDRLRGLDS
jgi:ribosome-associated heat shock protein Hsp15